MKRPSKKSNRIATNVVEVAGRVIAGETGLKVGPAAASDEKAERVAIDHLNEVEAKNLAADPNCYGAPADPVKNVEEEPEADPTTPPARPATATLSPKDGIPSASLAELNKKNESDATEIAAALAPAPTATKRQPTEEQRAIIAAARGMCGKGVLVVEAGAGAGKTTTLTMLEETLTGRGQYTAFNAALVKESKTKFKRAECNTTHSLAFRAVGKRFANRLGGARVRSDVVARMLGVEPFSYTIDVGGGPATRTIPSARLAAMILGAVKRFCQSADREIEAKHVRYVDGIDLPVDGKKTYAVNERLREHLLPAVKRAWADLSNPDGRLPYAQKIRQLHERARQGVAAG